MNHRASRLGTVLLLMSVLALLAAGVMLFGGRLGLWEPVVGFALVRTWLEPMGLAVTGLGLAGTVYLLIQNSRAAAIRSGLATVIGLGLLAPTIMSHIQPPVRYPPIHDITTDPADPPAFVVLDDTRSGARNTLVYGGAEIAAQQRDAYPDIAPIRSDLPPADAFAEALRTGREMGWEIVAEDAQALRFEATARTPVFHFADDVVVMVTPEGNASRIDIRSVSRVGRGDMGVNAARIRAFVDAFAG